MGMKTMLHLLEEKSGNPAIRKHVRSLSLCILFMAMTVSGLFADRLLAPFRRLCADEGTVFSTNGLGATVAGLGPVAPAFEFAAASAELLSATVTDNDYSTFVTPEIAVVSPVTPGSTITPQVATDETLLAQNLVAVGTLLKAASISSNRAVTAESAGKFKLASEQFQAAELFIGEAGALLSQETSLRLNLYNDLQTAGSSSTVTAAQISQLQQQYANGLPSSEVQELTGFGLNAAEIKTLTNMLISVAPTSAAGTYPDFLVSTPALSNLQSVAAAFTGFQLLVNPATQGVINLSGSAPITAVILGSQALDVTTLEPHAFTFGPSVEDYESLKVADYNGDGIPDLILTFNTSGSGLQVGDQIVGFCVGDFTHGNAAVIVQ